MQIYRYFSNRVCNLSSAIYWILGSFPYSLRTDSAIKITSNKNNPLNDRLLKPLIILQNNVLVVMAFHTKLGLKCSNKTLLIFVKQFCRSLHHDWNWGMKMIRFVVSRTGRRCHEWRTLLWQAFKTVPNQLLYICGKVIYFYIFCLFCIHFLTPTIYLILTTYLCTRNPRVE